MHPKPLTPEPQTFASAAAWSILLCLSLLGWPGFKQRVPQQVRSGIASIPNPEPYVPDSFRGSSDKIGTMQRRSWPLRKDDTHKSRSVPSKKTKFLNP